MATLKADRIAVYCGALALSATALAPTLMGDLLDLGFHLSGPPFAVAVSLAIAASLARRRRVAFTSGWIVVFCIWIGGPQWFPPNSLPRAGSPVLTVYSSSVGKDNTDVEAVKRSIHEADADILMLIEVGDTVNGRLDEVLADYPYRVISYPAPRQRSRSPIAARTPLKRWPSSAPGLHEVVAVAETPVGPITFVGVHLTRPWPFRYKRSQPGEVTELAEVVREIPGPVVAGGDFNSTSAGRTGRRMREEANLTPAPGWPGTWPSFMPPVLGVTIDQIYTTPDLSVSDRRVAPRNGSDHRPVITRLVLADRN